jgi:hypothetical protein
MVFWPCFLLVLGYLHISPGVYGHFYACFEGCDCYLSQPTVVFIFSLIVFTSFTVFHFCVGFVVTRSDVPRVGMIVFLWGYLMLVPVVDIGFGAGYRDSCRNTA